MLGLGEDDDVAEINVREALRSNPTDWLTAITILRRRPDLVSLRQRYRKYTPLHSAASECKPDYVSLLLHLGAAADARDAFGFTPLATAANADTECLASARALLHAGAANPFPTCGSRGSPLHAAALRGHVAIAALLLASAADCVADALALEDWRGCTALDVARENHQVRVATLIEQAGGRPARGKGGDNEVGERAAGRETAAAEAVTEEAAADETAEGEEAA